MPYPYGADCVRPVAPAPIPSRIIVAPPEVAEKVKPGSRQNEIRELLAKNLAYAEIARRLGMHHTTIMYHARKLAREIAES